jgi:hypothetical protein
VSEPSPVGVSPQKREFMATAKLTEQHVQTGLQKLEGWSVVDPPRPPHRAVQIGVMNWSDGPPLRMLRNTIHENDHSSTGSASNSGCDT